MLSRSFVHISARIAGNERKLAAAGVVIAAAVALLLGDTHSLGMTHN